MMKEFFVLMTIVRRDSTEKILELFTENNANINFVTPCNGTARQKTLNLLGIEQTEKSLIITVISGKNAKKLLNSLKMNLPLHMPDSGIAFMIPISSLGGAKVLEYLTEDDDINETEENEMNIQSELILTICESGYTELVMDAARTAGATGGTTIKAKGTGAKRAEKFFGLSIAEEKEIVLIVSPTELKKNIMTAIMSDAGMTSKAQSLVISIPVSDVEGVSFFNSDEKII